MNTDGEIYRFSKEQMLNLIAKKNEVLLTEEQAALLEQLPKEERVQSFANDYMPLAADVPVGSKMLKELIRKAAKKSVVPPGGE